MDRRVKERLVGATILAVLIVLIVPELLSGPHAPRRLASPAEPVRNVTVDLATSKATPAGEPGTTSSGSLEEPAPAGLPDAPAPAATDDAPAAQNHHSTGVPTVATLPQQPSPPADNAASPPNAGLALPKAAAAAPRLPATDNAHRNWAVQLGSFASRVNAEKLERRLKTQSFPAFISASGAGKTLRYRVRVGPMADRASAERALTRLRKEGLPASVIPL